MSQAELPVAAPGIAYKERFREGLKWTWRMTVDYPSAAIATVVLLFVIAAVVVGPFIVPFHPNETVGPRLLAPGTTTDAGTHWLGTDDIGRDFFSRVLMGGRISIMVGLVAPTVGIGLGALIGITSAYFGGWIDMVLQRFTDIFMAIPSLIWAMAITISMGFTPPVVILAIAIGIFGYASRLMRSHAMVLRQAQFLEASRALGASNARIILRHMVPNSWAPWIVMLAVNVGGSIGIEAALSFLGIGISPPTPSWGNLMTRAQIYFVAQPWLVIAPGLLITVVVFSINMFGDALRDILDPKLRGTG